MDRRPVRPAPEGVNFRLQTVTSPLETYRQSSYYLRDTRLDVILTSSVYGLENEAAYFTSASVD